MSCLGSTVDVFAQQNKIIGIAPKDQFVAEYWRWIWWKGNKLPLMALPALMSKKWVETSLIVF